MSNEFLTIAEASKLIKQKKLSPVELTRSCLAKIERLNNKLFAFITVTADRALSDARKAEQAVMSGTAKSELTGIPIGLKDIIDTKGIRTTCHSAQLEHNVPGADAAVATLLDDAGTVLLGKLATHEFADGGPSFDLPWPPARNPWNTDHFTAGSSSGTGAAVAAGLILGGLGTDTGGSIRGPSALCGISGIKPTYGLVSRRGVAPAAFSRDHIGPMAWTVEDCAILLQTLAGHDPLDPASAKRPIPNYRSELGRDIKGMKIGVIRHFHESDNKVSPATLDGINKALAFFEQQGAEIREVKLTPLMEWQACGSLISMVERFAAYEQMLIANPTKFGERLLSGLLLGGFFTGSDYVEALRRRREMCNEMASAMTDLDVMITATQRAEAPLIDSIPKYENFERPGFTSPFNVTGYPAMSICTGFGDKHLPIAMQIIAKPFAEARLFRFAYAYEQATPWRSERPALASAEHAMA
ncbi:MAG TPA: amidase [Beijerinckiaceae bacterium]|nr:amidase [Beijerinckiaceae bacterium]